MSSPPVENPSSLSFWNIKYWAFHCASGPPSIVTRLWFAMAAVTEVGAASESAAGGVATLPPAAASSSSCEAIFTEEPENLIMLRMWLPFVPEIGNNKDIYQDSENRKVMLTDDGSHGSVGYVEVGCLLTLTSGRHPWPRPGPRHEGPWPAHCSAHSWTLALRVSPRPPVSGEGGVGGARARGDAGCGHHGGGGEAGEHERVRRHHRQVRLVGRPQLGGHLGLRPRDVGDLPLDGDHALGVETVDVIDRAHRDPCVGVLSNGVTTM